MFKIDPRWLFKASRDHPLSSDYEDNAELGFSTRLQIQIAKTMRNSPPSGVESRFFDRIFDETMDTYRENNAELRPSVRLRTSLLKFT